MKTELLTVSDRLVGAGITGLYQGIIIVLIVAVALRLGRTNAATRHAVWFCTLLLVAGLTGAHLLLDQPTVPAGSAADVLVADSDEDESDAETSELPEISSTLSEVANPDSEPTFSGNFDAVSFLDQRQPKSALPFTLLPRPEQPANHKEGTSDSLRASSSASENASTAGTQSHSQPDKSSVAKILPAWLLQPLAWKLAVGNTIPRTASAILVAFWAAVAATKIGVLFFRLYQIRKMKRRARRPSLQLAVTFDVLRERLSPRRDVELKICSRQKSPMLLGFRHPVILLPADASLDEAEQVLRHELGHAHRRDDWVNCLQHFTQAVLFFHPAIWWISKRLSLEREIACDDYVLQDGGRPRAYALTLANLAARLHRRPLQLAPGASANKTQLQERIDMILNTKRNVSTRLAKARLGLITSTAACVAIAATYAAPKVVLAQETTPVPARTVISAGGSVNTTVDAAAVSSTPAPSALARTAANLTIAPVATSAYAAQPEQPAAGGPTTVHSGPKAKPENSYGEGHARTIAIVPSTTPIPSVAPVPPTIVTVPGAVIASAEPFGLPRTPRPPKAMKPLGPDASLEERLARLEEMVRSLAAQQEARQNQAQLYLRQGALDHKQVEKLEEASKKLAELAEKQATTGQWHAKQQEEAAREMSRSADNAAREKRDAEKRIWRVEPNMNFDYKFKFDGKKMELDALRKYQEQLRHELEHLNRQIEQLENQKQRSNEEQDNGASSESSGEKDLAGTAPARK
jgi:beta-lactamase regulating signal transducer with metallopeptidase domain